MIHVALRAHTLGMNAHSSTSGQVRYVYTPCIGASVDGVTVVVMFIGAVVELVAWVGAVVVRLVSTAGVLVVVGGGRGKTGHVS